eukprot:NODE_428_length_2094_cov_6.608802_g343_i0.p12 GENE.NODE_428_length_2094_cov_6.608802_g343_i0~~NODE_428_length_2094_cov_6.608802_g343_i0.p12  ORF type:complete len:53 (-),score=1.67 NODE_428_length_2094_cov_6.608802_g343_i0:1008-1166(-)
MVSQAASLGQMAQAWSQLGHIGPSWSPRVHAPTQAAGTGPGPPSAKLLALAL